MSDFSLIVIRYYVPHHSFGIYEDFCKSDVFAGMKGGRCSRDVVLM